MFRTNARFGASALRNATRILFECSSAENLSNTWVDSSLDNSVFFANSFLSRAFDGCTLTTEKGYTVGQPSNSTVKMSRLAVDDFDWTTPSVPSTRCVSFLIVRCLRLWKFKISVKLMYESVHTRLSLSRSTGRTVTSVKIRLSSVWLFRNIAVVWIFGIFSAKFRRWCRRFFISSPLFISSTAAAAVST